MHSLVFLVTRLKLSKKLTGKFTALRKLRLKLRGLSDMDWARCQKDWISVSLAKLRLIFFQSWSVWVLKAYPYHGYLTAYSSSRLLRVHCLTQYSMQRSKSRITRFVMRPLTERALNGYEKIYHWISQAWLTNTSEKSLSIVNFLVSIQRHNTSVISTIYLGMNVLFQFVNPIQLHSATISIRGWTRKQQRKWNWTCKLMRM